MGGLVLPYLVRALAAVAHMSGIHCRAASVAGHAAVEALVHCLAARRTQPCSDTNDLALNALNCLHRITGQQGLLLPALPPQLHSALLAELCHAMAAHDTPLRVRMSVPVVLQRLAAAADNITPLAQAAGRQPYMRGTTAHSWCTTKPIVTARTTRLGLA